jgi:hypothetical protein
VWGSAGNSGGDTLVNNSALVPGLAAAWDATHDGRTVVRGSLSSYVDLDLLAAARHTNGTQAQRRCQWNPTGGPRGDGYDADGNPVFDANCTYSGGQTTNTFGSPCGPTGIRPDGSRCHEKLKLPRTSELTLGVEREVTEGVAVSLDAVYRKFANQFDRRETNRIWNASGTDLEGGSRAGASVLGGYRNGRPETILDMSTPDGAWRRYQGLTVGLSKRQGRFKAHASYTLSRLTGTQTDLTNQWGDIPGRDVFLEGPLADDHLHELKTTLQWQATPYLAFGLRYKFLSGMPYNHTYYSAPTNSWEQYRARVGQDPGANVNDPGDDRALRTPDRQDVNLQIRFNLLPLIRKKLDLYADVLNVFALRTPTAYGDQDMRNFGVETGWMEPLRIRLGLNYRY